MIRLLFLLCFISFSCNISTSSVNTDVHTNQTDTTAYYYQEEKQISNYFVNNDDYIDTTYFHIKYPIFKDDTINNLIRPSILLDGEENAKQVGDAFISAYDEFVEEVSTESIGFPWSKEINSEVLINKPKFISLQTSVVEYTGGAHPNHYTIISNYDPKQLKKIELKDILIDGGLQKLTQIGEKYFRRNEKLSDSTSLSQDFFFDNGLFSLNDNFGLHKKYFYFYYNVYEIKPYAEGVTILEIPYEDLEGVFNERGKEYIRSVQQF